MWALAIATGIASVFLVQVAVWLVVFVPMHWLLRAAIALGTIQFFVWLRAPEPALAAEVALGVPFAVQQILRVGREYRTGNRATLQFSLATLLIATTIIGLLLAQAAKVAISIGPYWR